MSDQAGDSSTQLEKAEELRAEIADRGRLICPVHELLLRLGEPSVTPDSRLRAGQALANVKLRTEPSLSLGPVRADSLIEVRLSGGHLHLMPGRRAWLLCAVPMLIAIALTAVRYGRGHDAGYTIGAAAGT